MQYNANSVDDYISQLPEDRIEAVSKIRKIFKTHLPKGFEECINYKMIGFVVPHSIYPKGYHCDTKLPLPFINIASQKNYIALYHMGIYADEETLNWFVDEYKKVVPTKIDMGKSCIRFKKTEHIPYELLTELAQKFSPKNWIQIYESTLKK